jgi:group II intron reverse transcriptase/maturase
MVGPQLEVKSFEINKRLVYEAWMKVQANNGAPGVDAVSIDRFADRETDNLYKLWNRMSSGSYFPGPVRAVEIPKDHGAGVRVLGVPNVADRVAQTTAAVLLEEKLEPIFHPDSYGYRPGRSAHDALAVARKRCWRQDWVLDLDVRAFFDSVPHDLLLKAVAHHTDERWVLLYIERWLKSPMQMLDGTLGAREKGTPQGSPISPLLANLFMHYAFDKWMDREHPGSPFERYADDVVVHCDTEAKALYLWAALAERLGSLGLELHPDKTKVVYCKDGHRRGDFEHTTFDFLGYTFRGRGQGPTRVLRELLTGHERHGEEGDRQEDQGLAPQPSQRHGPVRSRLGHQCPGPRLDQLLRSLLPLRVVLHRTAHRPASGPMGHAEVQAIAEEIHPSVGPARRCSPAQSPTLRSLASSSDHHQSACKSQMNREVHVRFCESRGVRFPPATRLCNLGI